MRRICPICLGVFIGLSLQQAAVFGKEAPAPASPEQLAQEFKSALQAKDRNAVLALYNWDGVADWVKAKETEDVDDWLTRDVKGVNLSPLPAGFQSAGQAQNVRFHLNVQAVGVIEAHFTDGFGVGFPYGRKLDAYYIAGVIVEKIAVHENATNKFLTLNVRTTDGKAVPYISAASGTPEKIPFLHFRSLYNGDELGGDEEGRLNLPQTAATNQFVVAASPLGFGWLPSEGLTNGATLVIHPWAGIEGTWKNRNKPMAGETLELSINQYLYAVRPVRIADMETRTDVNGHFIFTNVPPLKLRIDHFGGSIAQLDLTAGGTKELEIDTHGRKVLGRVNLGSELDANIDLAEFSGELDSAIRNTDGSRQSFYFQAASNGSFRLNPIDPGDYRLSGNVWQGDKHIAILEPVSLHVPEDKSGSGPADAPFDVGTVTLSPVVHLKPGDVAPDFTATTLDGQTLRLSDFRGRYVLLDFWATWCFWCVKEMPNLKDTYDAFGGDKRLAMVSLSLDSDRALPTRYARAHDIHWTQGFLGDWSDNKVTPDYGVFGIPAIFLIGPDGRIMATGLRGAKIKEAVVSALGR